jgi:WhiB family transcriptional regulator, redox-sensing transcriptional regulator
MTASPVPFRVPAPDPEWASRGACRDVDPESLFVVGAAQHKAKVICMGCPVRIDCLADALDSRTEFGVWGGMTERERRTLLRRRPDIASWRHFLRSAQRIEDCTDLRSPITGSITGGAASG